MQHFSMEIESRDNKDPYFTILHFVTVSDRIQPGTGANEKKAKKRTGDSRLLWNKGALFMAAVGAYILLYKKALGRK